MAEPDVYEALLREIPDLTTIQATADLAHGEPGAANAAILHGYVKLSDAFGRLLHGTHEPPENATFPTFAAWAAASLRPEVVPSGDPARGVGVIGPARRAFQWVARDVLDIEAKVARNIVQGQGAIYEEIGSTIYKMLRVVLDGLGRVADGREIGRDGWRDLWDAYARSLAEMPRYLKPAGDAREVLDTADVALLQRAVLPYFEVLMEGLSRPEVDAADRKRRAELILVANVRILAYEQRRLQPLFRRNFAYVPEAVRDRVRAILGRGVDDRKVVRRTARVSHDASALLAEAFQIAATRNLYAMVVGSETVRFGRDLPLPPPAKERLRLRSPADDRARYALGAFFPHDLEELRLGVTWAEWQRHDRSLGQGRRTAMDNWLRYGERMSFLVNLFRSRQQLRALYDEPSPTPSVLPPAPELRPRIGVGALSSPPRFSAPPREPVPTTAFLPDDVLDQLAARADRPADDLFRAVVDRAGYGDPDLDWTGRRAAFPELLRVIAEDDGGLVSGFVAGGEEVDEAIDQEMVRHARAFFEEHGVAIITALFHASLPEAYLARRGVQVLDLTGELVSNWSQRVGETGQFLINVLSPSRDRDDDVLALAHGGYAASVARRVRLRHAAVRWLVDAPYRPELPLFALDGIHEPAPWKVRMKQVREDRVPTVPLNQEDLLGTLGTFTTVTFRALDKLAIAYDADDRRAFHHLWNVIGWHLGIGDASSCAGVPVGGGRATWPDNVVLPLEVGEMDDLTVRLGSRLLGRTEEGARLAKTLVQELAYPLPAVGRGAPDFLVRYMIGDEHGDLLELGGGGYVQLFVRRSGALEGLARAARRTELGKRVIPEISQAVTRYALRLFVAQSRSTHSGLSIEPRIANLWGVPTGSEVRSRPR